jgi:hypothetical protein
VIDSDRQPESSAFRLSGPLLRNHPATQRLAVMFPFWIEFSASSLSALLVTLASTVSIFLSVFAVPR